MANLDGIDLTEEGHFKESYRKMKSPENKQSERITPQLLRRGVIPHRRDSATTHFNENFNSFIINDYTTPISVRYQFNDSSNSSMWFTSNTNNYDLYTFNDFTSSNYSITYDNNGSYLLTLYDTKTKINQNWRLMKNADIEEKLRYIPLEETTSTRISYRFKDQWCSEDYIPKIPDNLIFDSGYSINRFFHDENIPNVPDIFYYDEENKEYEIFKSNSNKKVKFDRVKENVPWINKEYKTGGGRFDNIELSLDMEKAKEHLLDALSKIV